jgi:hypothetical protein
MSKVSNEEKLERIIELLSEIQNPPNHWDKKSALIPRVNALQATR